MIYQQPVVLRWGSPREFLQLFVSKNTEARIREDWRVRKLRDLIDSDRARAQWSLEEICQHLDLCISARQARRLFKACTGMGIKEYAKKKRLEAAAKQLQTTDAPVKAIAIDAGYSHVRNFTRCFLKQFHLSPINFRRIWRYKDAAA